MIEAMTRPHRESYNAVIDTAKGILQTVRENKKSCRMVIIPGWKQRQSSCLMCLMCMKNAGS